MNTTPHLKALGMGSRILITVGGIAMLMGAVDPMEGSLVILPGSGLVALGTFLSRSERCFFPYRLLVFILIAMGIGAMWALTSAGGLGGSSGRSLWWGLLVLPYPIGWSMGMWGPGSPRWLLLLGIGVGLWYQAILVMALKGSGRQHGGAAILISVLGVATIVGCLLRLGKRVPARLMRLSKSKML